MLARWRITDSIQKGGLNVRVAPSKSAEVLLRLPKLTVLEASGPPQGDVTGSWLPIWNPEAPNTRAYAMLEVCLCVCVSVCACVYLSRVSLSAGHFLVHS